NEAVPQVVDLCVDELRGLKKLPVPDAELRRAKDHLKGSLMLSLENTASRMSHLARQEIYFEPHFGLDETLAGGQPVTTADAARVARVWFANGAWWGTIVGPSPRAMTRAQLALGCGEDGERARGVWGSPRGGAPRKRDCSSLYETGDGGDRGRSPPVRNLAR